MWVPGVDLKILHWSLLLKLLIWFSGVGLKIFYWSLRLWLLMWAPGVGLKIVHWSPWLSCWYGSLGLVWRKCHLQEYTFCQSWGSVLHRMFLPWYSVWTRVAVYEKRLPQCVWCLTLSGMSDTHDTLSSHFFHVSRKHRLHYCSLKVTESFDTTKTKQNNLCLN